MILNFVSARRLSERLARGNVTAQEQAAYVSGGYVLWMLLYYLFVIPPPDTTAWAIQFGLWFYEAGALLMIYVFGVTYCLRRCLVEPSRNFLVDFSCLNFPISLTTLLFVWGIFHLYVSVLPWWLMTKTFDSQARFIDFIYSPRFIDLMRFFAFVGSVFVVFIRVGNAMENVSRLRLSANLTLDPDAQKGDARVSI